VSALPEGFPEPLPEDALDAHTHLDMIERPLDDVLHDAQAVGITRMVTVGTDLASSRWAADCAAASLAGHPAYRPAGSANRPAGSAAPGPRVYAAVAVHPNETARAAGSAAERDEVLAGIAALAARDEVRAVGETGLDYYRDSAPPEVQREWFRAHIEIAKRSGKALMIHDRDAHEDVLKILEADGPPERVIFHCFSGDAAMVRLCAEAGYVMSFAGNVTFPSAGQLREAAAAAPLGLILAETDAPFLTPVPLRGRPNHPALTAHTLRALAAVKQVDVADLCSAVTATGERMFGHWAAPGNTRTG
jgi:TatD DNase family protein